MTHCCWKCFRRLAFKMDCAAVTPSLARQLSPSQIVAGIQGACVSAVHAMRRYVMGHIKSGQSHQNRLIDKLDLKNALNTVYSDHFQTECSERAPTIAKLAQLANSSTSLASGHPIIAATGIQQGDSLGSVLFAMAVDEVASSQLSEINIWYLKDGTLSGAAVSVFAGVRKCFTELKKKGLEVNPSKSST